MTSRAAAARTAALNGPAILPSPMTADDDAPAAFRSSAGRGASTKRRARRRRRRVRPRRPSPRRRRSRRRAPAPGAVPPAPSGARRDRGRRTPAPLPPVESLVFDSDFTPFLQPKVDETVKRQALKKLFQDPRFNVMDRLDVYIDDYSLPDPISPEVVRAASAHAIVFSRRRRRGSTRRDSSRTCRRTRRFHRRRQSALPAPDGALPPVPAPEADARSRCDPRQPDDGDPVQRDNEQPKP